MKKTLLTLLISSICMIANAQITDNESKLRDKKSTTDTIEGWKFGGMTDIKFSNTKLYNWAAGGEYHCHKWYIKHGCELQKR